MPSTSSPTRSPRTSSPTCATRPPSPRLPHARLPDQRCSSPSTPPATWRPRKNPIETPLETFTGRVLAKPLVIVPILRAGLGMLQPFTDIFPDVSVGYIGLERDHTTAVARSYYCKLPPLAGRTSSSSTPCSPPAARAVQAVTVVKENGGTEIAFVCIVAAPEGVADVQKAHPGTWPSTPPPSTAPSTPRNTSSPASAISATASTAPEPGRRHYFVVFIPANRAQVARQ
jgi:hypothetical protein